MYHSSVYSSRVFFSPENRAIYCRFWQLAQYYCTTQYRRGLLPTVVKREKKGTLWRGISRQFTALPRWLYSRLYLTPTSFGVLYTAYSTTLVPLDIRYKGDHKGLHNKGHLYCTTLVSIFNIPQTHNFSIQFLSSPAVPSAKAKGLLGTCARIQIAPLHLFLSPAWLSASLSGSSRQERRSERNIWKNGLQNCTKYYAQGQFDVTFEGRQIDT